MQLLIYSIHTVASIVPHLSLGSLLSSAAPQPAPTPPSISGGTSPNDINHITTAVGNIISAVVKIATAVAVLMVIVAGLYIILDRDMSTTRRNERLAFLRSILIGYGIILAASFLINLLQQFLNDVTR